VEVAQSWRYILRIHNLRACIKQFCLDPDVFQFSWIGATGSFRHGRYRAEKNIATN